MRCTLSFSRQTRLDSPSSLSSALVKYVTRDITRLAQWHWHVELEHVIQKPTFEIFPKRSGKAGLKYSWSQIPVESVIQHVNPKVTYLVATSRASAFWHKILVGFIFISTPIIEHRWHKTSTGEHNSWSGWWPPEETSVQELRWACGLSTNDHRDLILWPFLRYRS